MDTAAALLENISNPKKCDAIWLKKIQASLCALTSASSRSTRTGVSRNSLLVHAKSAMKLLNLVNQTLTVDIHKSEILKFSHEGNILHAAVSALDLVEKVESLLNLNPFDFEKAASGIVSRAIVYNEVEFL